MNHEQDRAVADLLVRAAPRPPEAPQARDLVAAGITRGRALRRRRRTGAAAAALAAVAVATAGVAVVAPHGAGDGRTTVATEPSTGAVTSQVLARLLPPGEVADLRDDDEGDVRRGSVLYEGTRVYVYVYRASSCDTAPLLLDVGCYDLTADGDRPRSVAGTETSAGSGDLVRKRSEADYTRPDGWRVSVVATNDAVAGGPVVRRTPALTWSELLTIARDGAWLPDE